MNVIKDVKFTGRILDQVNETVNFVKTQIRDYTKLGKNAVFQTIPEYPEFCWTELIVNAIAHRDYSIMGTDIQIKMFDDHLLVESPGTLPGLVRINNIREYHFSRNPKILEFLNEYDFVKEFGEGIDRVYRDMANIGLPEPVFKESEFMFYATLKNKYWSKGDASWEDPKQVTPQVPPKYHPSTTQVEKQEQDKILNFCFEPRSRKEIMDEMGYSDRKHFFNYYLKPLLESGKLIMTIPEKPNSSKQKYIVKKTEEARG